MFAAGSNFLSRKEKESLQIFYFIRLGKMQGVANNPVAIRGSSMKFSRYLVDICRQRVYKSQVDLANSFPARPPDGTGRGLGGFCDCRENLKRVFGSQFSRAVQNGSKGWKLCMAR